MGRKVAQALVVWGTEANKKEGNFVVHRIVNANSGRT